MNNNIYEFQSDDAFRFSHFVNAECVPKGTELQFKFCPYCRGGKNRDKNTFSINLKTGQYTCQRSSCGAKGNMITLARDFDFELSENVTRYFNWNNCNSKFKQFHDARIESRDRAIAYMKSRGISAETCKKYEITIHKDNESVLVFPFKDESGHLKLIKYRNIDFVKGETKGSKEWCETNCMPILFGMNKCNFENETLVITEGQMDSLSLADAGIENAVSVPYGVNAFTWVPYCWDFVNRFKKIIIFGDLEKGKVTLVDDIAARFKIQVARVREVDYKGCKDANEILQKHGRQTLIDAVNNAECLPIKNIIDLADVEPIDVFKIEKLKTGIKSLDSLLYGGIPFGGVTLIAGKPGEGKSTVASQILINAIEQNYSCLAYSGELTNGNFKAWMNFQVAGPSHIQEYQDSVFHDTRYRISDTNKNLLNDWYRGKCFLYDNSSIEGDEKENLLVTVENAILQYGINVVLIDNLMTALDLEKMNSFDKYDKQSAFVKKLARLAIKHNIVILLVAHKRKNNFSTNENDEISGSGDIANLATITLVYEKDKELREGQRRLKVSKNRLFGKLNTTGWVMDFDEKSKRIYGEQDQVDVEYSWVKNMPNNGFVDVDYTEVPFD